jgi:hypothetical protein
MFFTINAKLVFVSIPDFLQRRIFAIAWTHVCVFFGRRERKKWEKWITDKSGSRSRRSKRERRCVFCWLRCSLLTEPQTHTNTQHTQNNFKSPERNEIKSKIIHSFVAHLTFYSLSLITFLSSLLRRIGEFSDEMTIDINSSQKCFFI